MTSLIHRGLLQVIIDPGGLFIRANAGALHNAHLYQFDGLVVTFDQIRYIKYPASKPIITDKTIVSMRYLSVVARGRFRSSAYFVKNRTSYMTIPIGL